MIRKYLFPLLAILGLISAIRVAFAGSENPPPSPAVAEPAASPYRDAVSGSGIVESASEDISIGSYVPGIVSEVFAKAGAKIAAGDPLFRIDDREVLAEVKAREAAVVLAQAELRSAQVARDDAAIQNQRVIDMRDVRVLSTEERDRRRFALLGAEARLASAGAVLKSREAELEGARTELERHTVRTPIDAEILKVNVRVGQFAPAGPVSEPLVLIGDTRTLHVRVDVDENDAWRVRSGVHGTAYLRGNRTLKTPLTFVRFEPYVIPKRSLTGSAGERTDTRVLQVIFAITDRTLPVYVGQLVDAFIDAAPVGSGSGTSMESR